MTKKLLSASLAAVLLLAGCGDDDDDGNGGPTRDLTTPVGIAAYLEGKTLVMEGDDIPSHPLGFSENLDLGDNTPCYQSVTIDVTGGVWNVETVKGTLENVTGGFGTCNHDLAGDTLTFDGTVTIDPATIEGEGECFDVDIDYGELKQEGRASFNAAATELTLEIFPEGVATNIRCADVGEAMTVATLPFTGDAKQVYEIQ